MPVNASTVSLLPPSPSSSATPLSLLFDPHSHSLAVTFSDSSLLLFPSFAPLDPRPCPLLIPPISTSACFLLLKPSPNPNPNPGCLLFISAAPSPSSPVTLLRAWIRRSKSDLFASVGLRFKSRVSGPAGLALELRHGFGVKLAGSVNVLVVHSVAESRIWVLGVRMEEGEGDERVELVKCAMIGCTRPIYDIRVSMGVLVLGEVGGVRVFPLRLMVKGGQEARRKKRRELNGVGNGAGEKRTHGKLRMLKIKQDSGDLGLFYTMTCAEVQEFDSCKGIQAQPKAVTIHVLSQKKFLILDSIGELHLLSLQNSVLVSEVADCSARSTSGQLTHVNSTLKVQLFAVLPDLSTSFMVVRWFSYNSHVVSD